LLSRQIEEVALNSWPALQQILFDGWILRFSKGYTKRANSINPIFASTVDVREKITTSERLFREKGLPPVFRLTPFSSPPELDDVLEGLGYRKIDLSMVLCLDLRRWQPTARSEGTVREETLDDWMDVYCRLASSPSDQHQAHREILRMYTVRANRRHYLDAARQRSDARPNEKPVIWTQGETAGECSCVTAKIGQGDGRHSSALGCPSRRRNRAQGDETASRAWTPRRAGSGIGE